MGMTICEKILAKYSGERSVNPGDYISVSNFVGPIGYSYAGHNFPKAIKEWMSAYGLRFAKPENVIVNGDHNTPPSSMEDVELFKSVRSEAEKAGIKKIYDKEGIGHVVNIEKGDILPGTLFVNVDPQAMNAGGVGALFTDGGRFGGFFLEAFAASELLVRVPETIKIEINGRLNPGVTDRDVWLRILSDIGPDGALGKVIEYAGDTIRGFCIDQRLNLCSNAAFSGADGAIIASDKKTQAWFSERYGFDVELIDSDSNAIYADVVTYDASEFKPMVTYPPQVFTSDEASKFGHIKISQCTIGTCAGGKLEDLRIAAEILKGNKVHEAVRFIVSPATQEIYLQASRAGYLEILVEAGAQILPPTCDVCVGVQAPLSDGDVGLSQQTLNVPGRSGSVKADIYLAGAATIAVSSLHGRIMDPTEFFTRLQETEGGSV